MNIEDIALALEAEEITDEDAFLNFSEKEDEFLVEDTKELLDELLENNEISFETYTKMMEFSS